MCCCSDMIIILIWTFLNLVRQNEWIFTLTPSLEQKYIKGSFSVAKFHSFVMWQLLRLWVQETEMISTWQMNEKASDWIEERLGGWTDNTIAALYVSDPLPAVKHTREPLMEENIIRYLKICFSFQNLYWLFSDCSRAAWVKKALETRDVCQEEAPGREQSLKWKGNSLTSTGTIAYKIVLYVGFRELTLTFLLHLFDLETSSSFDWHKIQGGENTDLTKGSSKKWFV